MIEIFLLFVGGVVLLVSLQIIRLNRRLHRDLAVLERRLYDKH